MDTKYDKSYMYAKYILNLKFDTRNSVSLYNKLHAIQQCCNYIVMHAKNAFEIAILAN